MIKEMSQKEALDVFKTMFSKWNNSLSESFKNISKLPANEHGVALQNAASPTANCYAKGAVLWPTMGDGPCDTKGAIADYFAHFAAKNPTGKVVDPDNSNVTKIKVRYDANGTPEILVRGKYVFTMDDKTSGKRVDVACRFGFDVVQENGEWKWSGHNSDVLPSSQEKVKMTPTQTQAQPDLKKKLKGPGF